MDGNGVLSLRVLVIPEDPTHNGHILRPLVQAILADAGRPSARVQVLVNPRMQGYAQARRVIVELLPLRHRWFDLWLFFPDADRASADAMRRLETDLEELGISLFCCPAEPEVEIYACAAFLRDLRDMNQTWDGIRSNPRLKEEIFEPLLDRIRTVDRSGEGRRVMITQSLRNLPLLFRLCPELKRLRDRIAAHLSEA